MPFGRSTGLPAKETFRVLPLPYYTLKHQQTWLRRQTLRWIPLSMSHCCSIGYWQSQAHVDLLVYTGSASAPFSNRNQKKQCGPSERK